jgi:hypothetical protein
MMAILSKTLRLALVALLVGVCISDTASARERGGRRGKKSGGGSSSSYYQQPQPVYVVAATPTPAPTKTNPLPTLIAVPTNPVTTKSGSVDLVLEDLSKSDEATAVAGPAYAVRFRNQGALPAGKFAVLIVVSVDGKLAPDAPRSAIEIPALAAGESHEVILRLPATAMKPSAAGQTFHKLIVIVDPLESVRELDESNNKAIVDAT